MAEDLKSKIKKLVGEWDFTFEGTITKLGAATMDDYDRDNRTATVRINHMLHAPAAFKAIKGEHTIQLAKDRPLPNEGQSFVFFADGLAYGRTIAVAEGNRLPAEEILQTLPGEIRKSVGNLLAESEKDTLTTHMASADAVIKGTIVAMERAIPTEGEAYIGRPKRASDWMRFIGYRDDPDWWRATIAVEDVTAGVTVKRPEEVVLFANNSSNRRWVTWPKPAPEQSGMWILHSWPPDDQALEARFLPREDPKARFYLRDSKDYQPTEKLALLEATGSARSSRVPPLNVDEKKLRKHMKDAAAVVLGTVVAMERAVTAIPSSEAEWWRARIAVKHVARTNKGVSMAAGASAKVLFANSTKGLWGKAPKAKPGWTRLWILHRARSRQRELKDQFQILHPEDCLPVEQLDLLLPFKQLAFLRGDA